jgi:hypothetical protein
VLHYSTVVLWAGEGLGFEVMLVPKLGVACVPDMHLGTSWLHEAIRWACLGFMGVRGQALWACLCCDVGWGGFGP